MKKFQVTVTKTDAETGSPQGDASLAGAVYAIYKGEELIDTYLVDCGIQKIPLGRADFTDSPIIVTDIILGRKLTVFISRVGVNQFLTLIDGVNRTCKGSVALRRTCFCFPDSSD